mmetsp:Transcript_110819/g.309713  ORF Transcript_110819/g.309713 Transcript_110819/m.309713 type:complete len:208 (-) Transcript_110819:98-721(-)
MCVGVSASQQTVASAVVAASEINEAGAVPEQHDPKSPDNSAAPPLPEVGPIQQRWDLRSMDDLLDDFLAHDVEEGLDFPAAAWGGKVGITIFDEEEILGRYDRKLDRLIDEMNWGGMAWGGMTSPADTTPLSSVGGEVLFSDAEEDSADEHDDGNSHAGMDWDMDEEEWEEQEAYYDGNTDFVPQERGIYAREDDAVPRAAKRLQPF